MESGGTSDIRTEVAAEPSRPPAARLVGLTLEGGWVVCRARPRRGSSTGGTYSYSYDARHADGRKAFVKALDITAVLVDDDWTVAVERLLQAYNHEASLFDHCFSKRLSRIVRPLGQGTVRVGAGPLDTVPYLILENGDDDVRTTIEAVDSIDPILALQVLHHVAVALRQLHDIGIAHGDTKPSNIVAVATEGHKLTDLGSASIRGLVGPRDEAIVAGTLGYAPPELLYGFVSPDWQRRRVGCDAYHLGSLVVSLFVGAPMTTLLLTTLEDSLHPASYQPAQYADVLPHLLEAYDQALGFSYNFVPEAIRDPLFEVVRQLCHPDPARRGHPKDRALGRPYALNRYISLFDRLGYDLAVELSRPRRRA